jgi:hypothetical protein
MPLNPEYEILPQTLHEALLTSPATQSDCASHMITTGGLTLSQAQIEGAIDLIISDLAAELILPVADYAALLSRHGAAPSAKALSVLQASGLVLRADVEISQITTVVDGATSEWQALSQPQKDALPSMFAAGQDGIVALNARKAVLQGLLTTYQSRRMLVFP